MSKIIEAILKVNFGDIDGLYDAELDNYFLDDNYWEKIIDNTTYYVVGRKGTGKSAIYNWIHKRGGERGCLISNLSFKEFPFEKFLQLNDDDYSKPNQYQSIWRNIILSELAALIVKDQLAKSNDEFNELKAYVNYNFGNDLIDLHKQITKKVNKRSGGLVLNFLKANVQRDSDISFEDRYVNITMINRRLENQISNYLKTYPFEGKKFIVQFDQLDDNYNKYQKADEYFQSIISLFKVIYDINQTFRMNNIPAKVIGYLRSDIFNRINEHDAESARWDRYKLNLNWSIINKDDWNNSRLLKVINKRISSSLPHIDEKKSFYVIFNNSTFAVQNLV